jgi:2,4-dienoyl-CoA reductase-like NADH-dependent reductase (Old Yellow Enzyme family)
LSPGAGAEAAAGAALFSPLRLRNVVLRNRIVVSPMQMYSAPQARPGPLHLVHLGRFALGGAAMVCVEATAICAEGRSTLHDLGLWSGEQAAALRPITDFLRQHGAASAIQLQHAGRKASSQAPWDCFGPLGPADLRRGEAPWTAWGPTEAGWSEAYPPTHPVDRADVEFLLERYVGAARLARDAGFDAVEIHAAHGYLLHSFLSPLSNTRDDEFGGSLEGRMKFPLAVAKAVREAWPDDRPLLFRLSCVDGQSIGWSMDDSIVLAKRLRAIGVDAIDCSSGGMALPAASHLVARVPGFQVPFARAIRHAAGVPTIAVGLLRSGRQANAIVEEGSADLVALAREALWNPNFAAQAAQELDADPQWQLWPRQFGWWLQRRARTDRRRDAS